MNFYLNFSQGQQSLHTKGRWAVQKCILKFSSQDVAHDLEILESNGITHIVNVATGIPNYFERNFKYLSIQALDNPNENLKKHFVKAVKFMRKAIEEGGRVNATAIT